MAGVAVALGSTGCPPCGAPHPGFGRRDSDVGVMMGIVDGCGPTGLRVSCVLDPPCKVKSDRFAVTRGYESLGHCVTS